LGSYTKNLKGKKIFTSGRSTKTPLSTFLAFFKFETQTASARLRSQIASRGLRIYKNIISLVYFGFMKKHILTCL